MKKIGILKIFIIFFVLLFLVEIITANFIKKRLYKFDPIIGWDLRKNLKSFKDFPLTKSFVVSTNKFSLRIAEKNNLYNNPCDFDFVILGDSFVFGQGIDIENRFDVLINKELKSINFGVPGYSILQSYLKQKKYINQLNCKIPKKIILIIFKNDLIDAQSPHHVFRFRPLLSNEKLNFPNNLYLSLHGIMRDKSYLYYLSNLAFYKMKKNDIYYSDNIFPLINEIKYIVQDTIHNEIYIFLHEFKKEISNKILNNKICQKINCFETFFSYPNNPEFYFVEDGHWNEKGHKFFSNFLINKIKIK